MQPVSIEGMAIGTAAVLTALLAELTEAGALSGQQVQEMLSRTAALLRSKPASSAVQQEAAAFVAALSR